MESGEDLHVGGLDEAVHDFLYALRLVVAQAAEWDPIHDHHHDLTGRHLFVDARYDHVDRSVNSCRRTAARASCRKSSSCSIAASNSRTMPTGV